MGIFMHLLYKLKALTVSTLFVIQGECGTHHTLRRVTSDTQNECKMNMQIPKNYCVSNYPLDASFVYLSKLRHTSTYSYLFKVAILHFGPFTLQAFWKSDFLIRTRIFYVDTGPFDCISEYLEKVGLVAKITSMLRSITSYRDRSKKQKRA